MLIKQWDSSSIFLARLNPVGIPFFFCFRRNSLKKPIFLDFWFFYDSFRIAGRYSVARWRYIDGPALFSYLIEN